MLSRTPETALSLQTVGAQRHRAIGYWLWCIAALLFAMVVVGGATRLTQSGLSIVEWQPITGVVPPLGEAAWQAEFDKYKAIPQYQRLNRGMSLDEFRNIYWWEWGHRLLGRVIGAVFLLPLLWFLWRGWMDRQLGRALAGIFVLGAVQGAVGWWMVASGLAERVNVSQYRLAFHLTLACLIYVAVIWTAERVLSRVRACSDREDAVPTDPAEITAPTLGRDRQLRAANGAATDAVIFAGTLSGDRTARAQWPGAAASVRLGAVVLLALVIAQIYLGALVAGLHAGLIYNTWPLIDGQFIPSSSDLLFNHPWWRNFFENTLTVQFDHRMLAYALVVFALTHAYDVSRRDPTGPLANSAGFVFVALVSQAMIGVLTLLHSAPIGLAMLHQATGLVVLGAATVHAARTLAPLTHMPKSSLALDQAS